MAKAIDTWLKDDYAGMSVDRDMFYFGYEFGEDDEGDCVYGFEVTSGGQSVFRVSYDEMQTYDNCPDLSEMAPPLLFGIGLYLSHADDEGVD